MSDNEPFDSIDPAELARSSSDAREMPESLRGIDHAKVDRLGEVIVEPDDAMLMDLERAEEAAHASLAERAHDQGEQVPRALVIIVDDNAGEKSDRIGSLVAELLAEDHFGVDAVVRVASRKSKVRGALETAVVGGVDLAVTIGGVGVGPRDKTPEATKAVLDRRIPGIAQALRSSGLACGATDAGLSRGIAGISGSTVVVNLASSRAAIRDGMATLTPLVRYVINDMDRWNQ